MKFITFLRLLLNIMFLTVSINVFAGNSEGCSGGWSYPISNVKLLGDKSCLNIWELGRDAGSKNRLSLLRGMNLKENNNQWMSTGTCAEVRYNNQNYMIYNAYLKEEKSDIWMIYNNSEAYAYFREVKSPMNDGFNVNLKCAKIGKNEKIKYILNNYLKKQTSVNLNFYKLNDWYKEK